MGWQHHNLYPQSQTWLKYNQGTGLLVVEQTTTSMVVGKCTGPVRNIQKQSGHLLENRNPQFDLREVAPLDDRTGNVTEHDPN